MDKAKLLDKARAVGEERLVLARALDKYEQSQRRAQPTATGFLSPQEQGACVALLNAAAVHGGYAFFGGYEGAERKRLLFAPDWLEESELPAHSGICAVECRFYESGALSHRDFLGSLMALGLTREKLGDILVGENAAQILADEAGAAFLLREFSSAGRIRLTLRAIELTELTAPEVKLREIRDTVMSLRLDSVCASGFSVSRSRAAELIAAKRVQLNWRECDKADKQVAQGDVISCRGLGKFEVAQVGGLSKKGRTGIVLNRYE